MGSISGAREFQLRHNRELRKEAVKLTCFVCGEHSSNVDVRPFQVSTLISFPTIPENPLERYEIRSDEKVETKVYLDLPCCFSCAGKKAQAAAEKRHEETVACQNYTDASMWPKKEKTEELIKRLQESGVLQSRNRFHMDLADRESSLNCSKLFMDNYYQRPRESNRNHEC